MNIHGIELSDYPSSIDMAKYPYQMILKEELLYRALLTSKPIYYDPTSETYDIGESYDFALVSLSENGSSEVVSEDSYENLDGGGKLALTTYVALVQGSIWINYDVLNIETGEVKIGCYNNYPLPALPTVDRTVYPYVYIFEIYMISANMTMYMFSFTDKPLANEGTLGYYIPIGTMMYGGTYIPSIQTGWENVDGSVTEEDMYFTPGDDTTYTIIYSESPSEKYVLLKESVVKKIGNSIRSKTGKTDLIPPENMPSEIDGIETEPTLQDLTITENGTYTADSGYDGLGEVTVECASGGDVISNSIQVKVNLGIPESIPTNITLSNSSSSMNITCTLALTEV